ncbi:MAG: phosphorylase [Phormidesmis sp. CAN_BIN44]|nr:phosphorylase [Phormidesmis sp. CAN_BIN44]
MLKPGTLWTRVIEQTQHALECGALRSIPTHHEIVEQDGVSFLVRILANLARKEKAAQQQTQKAIISGEVINPFLPYEEDLFIADLSETHLCLLNKFNVVDYHLLIITRAFEEQERLLTLEDFAALWACLVEYDGLAFYNAGKNAGASQPHKHLQLIPLPLWRDGAIAIESWLAAAEFNGTLATIPKLPFAHGLMRLPSGMQSPMKAAEETLSRYNTLLTTLGLQAGDAYNLLATRDWILMVPRSQDSFASISVNSLGFAGSLVVRDQEQMQILKDQQPMTILTQVAMPIDQRREEIGCDAADMKVQKD